MIIFRKIFFEKQYCLACDKKKFTLHDSTIQAGVAKLADALDSKSGIRKDVWVRTPPPAL